MGGASVAGRWIFTAANSGAERVLAAMIADGWDAHLLDAEGHNLSFYAALSKKEKMIDSVLKLGVDPMKMGKKGCALSQAASVGLPNLVEKFANSGFALNQDALSYALGAACMQNTPKHARCCLALEKAGARWSSEPKSLNGFEGNCAFAAAKKGPLSGVSQSAGFAEALSVRHPPKKGRGAWLDWRGLDLDSERLAHVEHALLGAVVQPVAEIEPRRPRRV